MPQTQSSENIEVIQDKKVYLTRDVIFKVLSLLLLVTIMLPSHRMNYDLPTLAILETVFGFVFFHNFLKTFSRLLIPILSYTLLNFIVACPGDFKMGFLHPMMTLWLWIFPIVMAYELIRYKSYDTNRFIYYSSLVILVIIIIATLEQLTDNPIIMRDMTSQFDPEYISKMKSLNVGGYGIAYGCGAIFVTLIGCMLIYKLKGYHKILGIVLAVLMGNIVIASQFTTLLLIVVGVLAYQLMSYKKALWFRTIVAVIALVIIIFGQDIFLMVIGWFDDTVTSSHLKEIYNTLFNDAAYTNTRGEYMANSFALWFNSPIWGNDVSSGHNAMVIYESHSTIMTILCRTGILGLFAYLGAYWMAFKPIYKMWNKKAQKMVGIGIIAYFLSLSFLNPTENDILSYCIGLVAILTIYYLMNNQKENEYDQTALEK